MKPILILINLILIFLVPTARTQTIPEIIDRIYHQTTAQENRIDSLSNYQYHQKIHFIKMDGDDEIDEQSKREFIVYVRSQTQKHRKLISAFDYDEDKWIDVTEREKNNRDKSKTKSMKFSLLEMVAPENRENYLFELVEETTIQAYETIHLSVKSLEENEERFSGDLWFEKENYNLVKAKLIPSDYPTGVNEMIMEFDMAEYGELWLPEKITFNAAISFLFIFKGKVFSEITFEEYLFNQSLSDSLFSQ
jgi:hypothetical protein